MGDNYPEFNMTVKEYIDANSIPMPNPKTHPWEHSDIYLSIYRSFDSKLTSHVVEVDRKGELVKELHYKRYYREFDLEDFFTSYGDHILEEIKGEPRCRMRERR